MLCVTVEDEPRIAKQYESHYYCVCKNNMGKVMEDGKKVSKLHYFSADQEIMGVTKKIFFGAAYSTSNKFLLFARHSKIKLKKTTGLQKCLSSWHCKKTSQMQCQCLPL